MRCSIYSTGLVCCSVCAPSDMTKEQVIAEVNRRSPTGISSKWDIVDSHFRTGEENGFTTTCGGVETRHWVLTC